MPKPIRTRFSVLPADEAAALEHLGGRGFSPEAIEHDEEGLVVLVFPPLPDDQMHQLAQALPVHLSAKLGVVMDDRLPFAGRAPKDS